MNVVWREVAGWALLLFVVGFIVGFAVGAAL